MDRMKKLGIILVVIGVLNFGAFFVVSMCLGGDAINGKEENGHYYLTAHGTQTEVSREVFVYSRYHAISVFITHPLAMLSMILLGNSDRNKRVRDQAIYE